MSRFRFAKRPQKANDRTRRYRILRGEEREHVGEVEIGGDAPDGDSIAVVMNCFPNLAGAGREIALSKAKRFVDELASGWGLQVAEVPGSRWVERPEGRSDIRFDFQVVRGNP
ncbi:hypothetical protein [Limnoglobus roseus]|uniref:Uncharacterized protein n=1 Tax=Limnoglobus roseus TaxID=2598579 RepID=A0A5C1AHK8_9BACT|nr:hypothetical protein [Limnoglobus roseus]QEL17132.1 hypothetical protein PX52LOC_04113 [Limnoglobus roseus]